MNAAILHTLGQPPRYGTFEDPVAGDGEVLVTMRAAGIHPIVRAIASGKHYSRIPQVPFVPGIDGVGVRADGTRVYCGFARSPFGTLAEKTVVPAAMCVPLPDDIDDATAAAIGNPGMSAWLSLTWKAKVVAGETVLILGATGAAGHLAVRFAKTLGAARVIACGRNPQALDHLKTLGADAVISLDQTTESLVAAFAAETPKVDAVIDYLWGEPTQALLSALAKDPMRPDGRRVRLVDVGESAGPTVTLPASLLRGAGLEISGSGIGSASLTQIMQALPAFFHAAAAGSVSSRYELVPLAGIEDAWARGDKAGRLVVKIS